MSRYLTSKRRRIVVLAIVASFTLAMGALLGYYRFLRPRPQVTPDSEIYSIRGLDLSAHNGEIDFNKVSDAGMQFVILKATEGTDFKDKNFATNYSGARNTDLKVGAYHFFRFNTDGRMQAINFMHSVRNLHLDFPLIIDVEEENNEAEMSTADIVDNLKEMIRMLEYCGNKVMLYSNRKGYNRLLKNRFDTYPLWLANINDIDTDIPWQIWQYDFKGRVDGINGYVDLNTLHPAYHPTTQ